MADQIDAPKVNAYVAVGARNAQVSAPKVIAYVAVRVSTGGGGSAERKRAPRVYVRYGDDN